MLDDLLQRKPYNAVTDFVDAPVARGLAEKIAFIDAERSLSYGELQARSCRFAGALKDLGLRPEERLALLLYDSVDFPVAFWGALRAGSVALPLNTLLTAEQYAYILGDSRAAALVVAAPLAKTLLPILDRLPRLRTIILVNAGADEHAAFAGRDVYEFGDLVVRGPSTLFAAPTLSDEVAFWMYTSGSTGEPKGVKHVHTTLMAAARLMGQRIIGIREDDVVFSAAKLFFSYGMGNAMAFQMSVGATTVLLSQRPTPDSVFEVMRRHRPTVFYGVPTLYASLLAHKEMRRGAGSDRLRLAARERAARFHGRRRPARRSHERPQRHLLRRADHDARQLCRSLLSDPAADFLGTLGLDRRGISTAPRIVGLAGVNEGSAAQPEPSDQRLVTCRARPLEIIQQTAPLAGSTPMTCGLSTASSPAREPSDSLKATTRLAPGSAT